jgi:hypothetical protein
MVLVCIPHVDIGGSWWRQIFVAYTPYKKVANFRPLTEDNPKLMKKSFFVNFFYLPSAWLTEDKQKLFF